MPGLRQSVTGCVRAWSKNGGESLCRSTFRPRRRGFEASHLVLCKPGRLCYTLPAREHLFRLFLGSSAVEHSTVNRMVAGSNPARGAICSYSPNIHVHPRHPSLSVLLWVSFGYLGCRTRWRRPAPLFPAGPAIPNTAVEGVCRIGCPKTTNQPGTLHLSTSFLVILEVAP